MWWRLFSVLKFARCFAYLRRDMQVLQYAAKSHTNLLSQSSFIAIVIVPYDISRSASEAILVNFFCQKRITSRHASSLVIPNFAMFAPSQSTAMPSVLIPFPKSTGSGCP